MQRETGVRASKLMQIESEVLAFDFDRACTARIRMHDAEMLEKQTELNALQAAKLVPNLRG
jgi:hypothetical protein